MTGDKNMTFRTDIRALRRRGTAAERKRSSSVSGPCDALSRPAICVLLGDGGSKGILQQQYFATASTLTKPGLVA